MAKDFPADGFSFGAFGGSATWGVDADETSGITTEHGEFSVIFNPTTPSGDPQIYTRKKIPCTTGQPHRYVSIVQANRINAGDTFRLYLEWYDQAKAYLSQSVFWNAVLPAINTWYKMDGIAEAPASARFVRAYCRKNNVNFTGYLDYLGQKKMSRAFHVYRSGAFSVPGNSWTKIPFNAQTYQYGSMYNGATTQLECPADGVYGLTARIAMLSLGQGRASAIRFYKNGSPWLEGSAETVASPGKATGMIVTAPAPILNRGDYVDVRVWHNNATRNIDVLAFSNYFMATHLGD